MHAEKSATHWLKETLLNSRISGLDYCIWIYRIAVSVWTTSIYELYVCVYVGKCVLLYHQNVFTMQPNTHNLNETNRDTKQIKIRRGGFVSVVSVCVSVGRATDDWCIVFSWNVSHIDDNIRNYLVENERLE